MKYDEKTGVAGETKPVVEPTERVNGENVDANGNVVKVDANGVVIPNTPKVV